MTFATAFSDGSGDLGLVCLTGVVTQGSDTTMDDEEEDAPPGFSTGVSSSIGERFTASSSESGRWAHHAFPVCLMCSWRPVPRVSVVVLGMHWVLLAVAHSRWVRFSLQQQPLVVCLASLTQSSKASTPCPPQPLLTNSCPRSVF